MVGLLGVFESAGCTTAEEPPLESDERVGQTASPLLLQYTTWPRSSTGTTIINVCFSEEAKTKDGFYSLPGFTPGEGEGSGYRDWIIDAVQDSWARVANLQVSFFDSCPSNTNGWVVIHFNENHLCNPGTPQQSGECSDPGYQGGNKPNVIWLNQNEGQGLPPKTFDHHRCGYASDQPKPPSGSSYDALEKLRHDTMHEFGHTLGFGHNFNDPDVPADVVAGCKGAAQTGDLTPGSYDYGSVMDYCTAPCNGDSFGNTRGYFHARLSDFDIWNAQRVYGNKREAGQVIVGHRNRVIEVPGSNAYAGAGLEVFEFKGGLNEEWSFASGTNRIYTRLNTGLGWDVRGGTSSPTSGTTIQLYSSRNQPNQLFTFDGVELRGTGDNCLTAVSAAAGSKVELRRCTRAGTQSWTVDYGLPGGTRWMLTGTNLCVASPSFSPANGQDLRLEDCASAGGRAKFTTSGGALKFVGTSTLCLDTEVGDPAGAVLDTGRSPRSLDTYDANFFPTRAGRALQLFTCKSTAPDNLNQQFHVHGVIKGLSGQCVDIRGGIGVNGAGVQLYPCHGGPNQQWDAYVF
jgi:hypothetical protein